MRATPLLFDETFVHYAENTTSDTRIILFCDVERPLRTRVMTAVNRWVCRHLVRQTKTKNVDGAQVHRFATKSVRRAAIEIQQVENCRRRDFPLLERETAALSEWFKS